MLYSFCTLFLLYKLWRRKFLESLKCSFSCVCLPLNICIECYGEQSPMQEKKTQNTSLTRKWILFGSAAFCCCWCGQQFRKVIEGCYTSALICNYRLFCVQQFVRSIKYSLPSRYKHICYPLPQPQYSVSVNIWGHLLSLESVSVVYLA